jgi:hypothetical protein
MDDATKPVLGWRYLGDDAIYVVYNKSSQAQRITLPAGTWLRVADTGAWMEPQSNFAAPGSEYRMMQSQYDLAARSLAIFTSLDD